MTNYYDQFGEAAGAAMAHNAAMAARHAAARAETEAQPAPADQPTLRDRIDTAIDDVFSRWRAGLGDQRPQDAIRDAVMAVLPASADRAACDCEAEVHMGVGFYHHPWCATKRGAAPADEERACAR